MRSSALWRQHSSGAQAFGIQHAAAVEGDAVVERGSANETHVAQLVLVGSPSESSGEGDLGGIALRRHFEFDGVASHGVGIVGIAGEAKTLGGEDGYALAAIFDRNRTADAKVAALAAVLVDAGLFEQPHEGQTAAIQDGNFQVVDFHVDVVDPHGIENAQQVLSGGDENALAHQAGGVADARHVPPTGGNLEVIQIRAHEDDPRRDGSGENADFDGSAAMKPYTPGFDRALHRSFKTLAQSLS